MQFTCRECPDSTFVLRFAQFEALPGDPIHIAVNIQIQYLYSVLVRSEAPPDDAILLQGASGLSICIVSFTV